MTSRTVTTLIVGGALLLATAGIGVAQEATPDPATQTQAQKAEANGQAQGIPNHIRSARRLGPGDGSGNQGVKPADGSGKGSPGRMAAGSTIKKGEATASTNSKAAQKANKKAVKKANKTAAKKAGNGTGGNGHGAGSGTRTRARDLRGSGSGTCSGEPSGSQRRTGGSSGGARR